MKTAALLCMLAPLHLAGCSPEEAGPPPPGPIELRDAAHMEAFLSGMTFDRVGPSSDAWTFDAAGTFEAQVAGESLSGRWTADTGTLRLSALSVDGAPAADRDYPLVWLDGKLNIEIDRLQYRSMSGF